jgi:hypothetical protein
MTVDRKTVARDVAKEIDRRRRRRRMLVLLVLLVAAILAALYLRCGKGFGLGRGSGTGPAGSTTAPPSDAAPARCAIRLSATGITVDGKPASRADAIAACATRTAADVLITGDARQGDWDDLRGALETAGIAYFTREPRGVTAPDAGAAATPDADLPPSD